MKAYTRYEIVRYTVSILENEKGYKNLTALGSGAFGDVLRMYDKRRLCDIAVKVVTSDNIAEAELAYWPQMRHPNIVPLLDLFRDEMGTAVFIMPVQSTSLFDKLKDKTFCYSGDPLIYIKDWLHDVLCGLEYLHLRKICHMDVKADNILISEQHHVMLCDFTFVNSATKPLERGDLGSPYIYRPPEVCQSLAKDIKFDGISYDMWTYGVMIVEVLTYFVVSRKAFGGKYWYQDVYPTLFNALQEKQFHDAMANTFPEEDINAEEACIALNFIQLFLKSDPKDRFTTMTAMRHPFLGSGTDIGPVPDPIWISEVSTNSSIDSDCDLTKKSSPSPDQTSKQNDESTRGSFHNSLNSSSAGLKFEFPLTKNKRNKHGIMKWMRKKFSCFRKMFKCCSPANIMN